MNFSFQKSSSGFLSSVNNTVDKIMSVSNGILCLKNAFGNIPNPSSILMGLAGVAAGMISGIIGAVTDVVTRRVGQIINSILSPIRQIEQIITDITKVLISVQGILDKALNMDAYFKNTQNCANAAATLMNCLAQSAINKVTSKVAMEVDKHIGPIADSVSKEAFKVNGSISNYVGRQAGFMAKAQLQIKLLA